MIFYVMYFLFCLSHYNDVLVLTYLHVCIASGSHPQNHIFTRMHAPLPNNRSWWLLVHNEFAQGNVELLPHAITLDCLKGHDNYDVILEEFLLMPASALNNDQPFYASSYQHTNASVQVCDNSKSYYLSQNYIWFLKKLTVGVFAWIDVLCISPARHTLQEAFSYMGDLYKQSQVIADYLQHPKHWLSAEKRGWIYQESAFTVLSHIAMDVEQWGSPLGK
jgi:hypothetical protein